MRTPKPKGTEMALATDRDDKVVTHTSSLPNLVRNEIGLRRKRARLDRRISKLVWTMETDPMAHGAGLFETIDKLRLQVSDLDAAISTHVDAAARRQARRVQFSS